jgi:hypothetical protein
MCMPGGETGVQLKSKWPLNWAQAKSLGFKWDPCKKLSLMIAWGRRWSHKSSHKSGGGECLLMLHKPAMK